MYFTENVMFGKRKLIATRFEIEITNADNASISTLSTLTTLESYKNQAAQIIKIRFPIGPK